MIFLVFVIGLEESEQNFTPSTYGYIVIMYIQSIYRYNGVLNIGQYMVYWLIYWFLPLTDTIYMFLLFIFLA